MRRPPSPLLCENRKLPQIGSGGVQALADCLEKNSVMYGLVRVTETTKGASSSSVEGEAIGGSNKEKFCCVKWAPEDGPADQRTPELQVGVMRVALQAGRAKAAAFDIAVDIAVVRVARYQIARCVSLAAQGMRVYHPPLIISSLNRTRVPYSDPHRERFRAYSTRTTETLRRSTPGM